jgi:chaperonin GroEL
VLRVGAATETEMKYLKLKIEDAVNATKAAIEEGIVPGGGVALVKVAQKIRERIEKENKEKKKVKFDEFSIGYEIMLKALEAPLRQIVINTGEPDGSVILEQVRSSKGNGGYNALTNKPVEDMLAAGIIDPVKVTRSAVQNAASAAAILLTTEVAITEDPEDKKQAGGMPGGMPGMGMDY